MKSQYINPYLAGVLLGLLLLASFVIAGRGIGASGFMSQSLVHIYDGLAIEHTYLAQNRSAEHWWQSWIVIEVIGIFMGALVSAKFAGRIQKETVSGVGVTTQRRLLMALLGGVLMGFAARLARGCTSGQALTGGALLSSGSWLFMLMIFVGAYLAIQFTQKDWQ